MSTQSLIGFLANSLKSGRDLAEYRVYTMTQKTPLYNGKAKVIFEGSEDGTLIQHFKDDATAFNAQKKDVISGKGILNNYISEHIMMAVGELGIPNHFISRISDR